MYDTFHGGVELDDEGASEKSQYNAWLLELVCGESRTSGSYWDGGVHVARFKSHRTGSIWEIRSEPAYPGLSPVSARRIMARGPNSSPSMRRAYGLLSESYNLPDLKDVTGKAYLALCEHQLPVLPAHPSNHAHLAGAGGIVLREALRHIGPRNGAFITHLLDAVPLDRVPTNPFGPLQYRESNLLDLNDALAGYVFLVVGFDEIVIRTYNPVMKQRKSTQFIDDHIETNSAYHDVPNDKRTRWWVPHIHEVVVAIDPSGHVLSFDRLKRLLEPLRTQRHALQIQPLVGGRGRKSAGDSFASTILDYSNKRLGNLNDKYFRHLVEWHTRAPISGIFDSLVDATDGAELSPVIQTLSSVRDDMHRIIKTGSLHKPGIATLDEHFEWFEGRLPFSNK
ncbi:MAG: hypothetical protein ABMA14_16365 [Hyphomonadaceae bacterium]